MNRTVGDAAFLDTYKTVSTVFCRLVGITGLNDSDTDTYIQVFDKVPGAEVTPIFSFPADANRAFSLTCRSRDMSACYVAQSSTAETYTPSELDVVCRLFCVSDASGRTQRCLV